jgi:aryl-alcohol dehydrogenase-like predicted oxidoreductase
LPFYPLANGLLTGKVRPGEAPPAGTRLASMPTERSAHWLSDEMKDRVGSLLAYADSVNTPLLTIAFSWLLAHRAVASVIAGASSPEQIRANAESLRELTPGELEELARLTS